MLIFRFVTFKLSQALKMLPNGNFFGIKKTVQLAAKIFDCKFVGIYWNELDKLRGIIGAINIINSLEKCSIIHNDNVDIG